MTKPKPRSWLASHFITIEQAIRVRDAAIYAYCAGFPLNRFLTFHLGRAEVCDPHAFVSAYLKRAGEWLRRNSGSPAHYIWVLENPLRDEQGRGGLNLHVLIHVPGSLASRFRKMQRGWITQSGGNWKSAVLVSKAMKHSGSNGDRALYLRHGLLGCLRYVLKGIDPATAEQFGVNPEHQGVIVGKRVGYARIAAGALNFENNGSVDM